MPTETHPIDARPSISLLAAAILIVGFGVLALAGQFHPRSESTQGSSTDEIATEAVAEFGD